jgi:hypothetical protein
MEASGGGLNPPNPPPPVASPLVTVMSSPYILYFNVLLVLRKRLPCRMPDEDKLVSSVCMYMTA